MADSSPVNSDQPHLAEQLHRTSGSYELVLGPVLFAIVGLFIDRWLGTTPLFIIGLTIFAIVGAAVSSYYRYRYQIDQLEAETLALKAKAEVVRQQVDTSPPGDVA